MSRQTDLHNANRDRKDEFYTQLTDVEKEMSAITDRVKKHTGKYTKKRK